MYISYLILFDYVMEHLSKYCAVNWYKAESMDEIKTAMNDHLDQVQEVFEKISSELRVGMQPAVDNFIGFFHAIDWKVYLSTWIYSCYQVITS